MFVVTSRTNNFSTFCYGCARRSIMGTIFSLMCCIKMFGCGIMGMCQAIVFTLLEMFLLDRTYLMNNVDFLPHVLGYFDFL